MARFYMHLVDGTRVLPDPDGVEMDAERVAQAALFQARDCIAHDVKSGKLDLGCRIDVHDENGRLVHSLPFRDALKLVALN